MTYLKNSIWDFQNRDIKSSSSKIKDCNQTLLVVHSIGQSGCCRLIDNPFNLKASDSTCIFRGLTLSIIEVCWNSDYCLGDRFSKVRFCCFLHLGQHKCTDLAWWILFAICCFNPGITIWSLDNFVWHHLHLFPCLWIIKAAPNQPLCSKESILGICYCLALGWSPNKAFTLLIKSNNRWCCSCPFSILDDLWVLQSFWFQIQLVKWERQEKRTGTVFTRGPHLSLHNRDTWVSSSQINSNNVISSCFCTESSYKYKCRVTH